jgi:hypothetical protein
MDYNDVKKYFNLSPLEITFSEPVYLRTFEKKPKIIHRVYKLKGEYPKVYFGAKKNSRYLYPLTLNKIISVKHLQETDEFETFEEFKRQFDTRFITEDEIKNLWDKGSYGHGGQYRKDDFKSVGKKGKRVIERFLKGFKNVNEITDHYLKSNYGDYKVHYASEQAYSNRRNARDISIKHREGSSWVNYSSEYAGCGNGAYYLLVGNSKILHMEND